MNAKENIRQYKKIKMILIYLVILPYIELSGDKHGFMKMITAMMKYD